uniref:Sialin-like n=1 Tax=Neolamprologus brichardi TaxID=32507 RepID=A0A3Q4HP47_NEOBR
YFVLVLCVCVCLCGNHKFENTNLESSWFLTTKRWAPPLERSRLIAMSASGGSFGAFVALPLTGYICQMLGWPTVVGCVLSSQKSQNLKLQHQLYTFLMSVFIFLYFCVGTKSEHLSVCLYQNGFLSSLPYLGSWLMAWASGVMADALIERRVFSVTVVRKIFTLVGLFLPSVFLAAVVYTGCDHILTVTFLTLSMTTGGFSAAGVFINQIDIAPRWVSSSKQLIKFLLLNSLNPENMKHIKAANHLIFWVAAGINAGGAVIYTLFGSGKLQPWALTEEERAEAERKRNRSISH